MKKKIFAGKALPLPGPVGITNSPYEEVCLHDYQTVQEAREQLAGYFRFYNHNQERFHLLLGCKTPAPAEVYFGQEDN